MKALALAIALAVPLTVAAQNVPAPRADAGFHERLYARYCDKLRESPEAYVRFVKRMYPIHGYTYEDFAPAAAIRPVAPGTQARADCGVGAERIAEVHKLLAVK